jgi:site-specific DNA-methyltransferase (adenine-specific)
MIEKKNIPKKILKHFKLKEKKTIKVKGYISHLCDIFDDSKRVISPYGSLWVNLGDKYVDGHQMFVPGKFAIEMQKRGWILKQTIIWHRPSVQPSSSKRKFCNDYEYLFHFVKDMKKYYFNMVYEPFAKGTKRRCKAARSSEKSKEQSSYISPEAQQKWSKKMLDGKYKGRHHRTTWLYKPEFMTMKEDLTKEEKKIVINKLIELDLI